MRMAANYGDECQLKPNKWERKYEMEQREIQQYLNYRNMSMQHSKCQSGPMAGLGVDGWIFMRSTDNL